MQYVNQMPLANSPSPYGDYANSIQTGMLNRIIESQKVAEENSRKEQLLRALDKEKRAEQLEENRLEREQRASLALDQQNLSTLLHQLTIASQENIANATNTSHEKIANTTGNYQLKSTELRANAVAGANAKNTFNPNDNKTNNSTKYIPPKVTK